MSHWSDDDLRDEEFPDEPDDADSEDLEMLPCPNCGAEIYEEAEQCPACGHYVTFSRHPLQGWSWGWMLLGLLGVLATVLALIFATC